MIISQQKSLNLGRTKKHLNSFMSGIADVLVNMDEKEREFIERSVQEDPEHDNQLTLAS